MRHDYFSIGKYGQMDNTFRVKNLQIKFYLIFNIFRLPCIQPYKRITEKDVIQTINWGITIANTNKDQPINERKQGSAFPPNYIHSLDSSHMMYTCLRANKE